jgi:hypothetical protein
MQVTRAYPDAPYAKVGMSAAATLATSAPAALPFDTEGEDAYGMHDNVTNNSRLVCVKAGIYSVAAQVTWAANNSGRRVAQITKNGEGGGGTFQLSTATPGLGGTAVAFDQNVAGPVRLAVGDYLEVTVYQNSGGNLSVGGTLSWLAATWLRP